ncbi:MAG: hypothetical protein K2M75_03525 [Clostridia bacterium]|nr:hypothetical protein [Clostridia bacterium]
MKKNNNNSNQGFYNWNNSKSNGSAPSFDFSQMAQNGNSQPTLESEINKYSHMSEERLMQEMFALVNAGRQNGTLDNAKLEEFFNSASCMLSSEQIVKLRSLIDMAKQS